MVSKDQMIASYKEEISYYEHEMEYYDELKKRYAEMAKKQSEKNILLGVLTLAFAEIDTLRERIDEADLDDGP
jgi:hypothetical protein